MGKTYFIGLILIIPFWIHAQKNISFKDSLDNKFDLSDWVIHANGFIPVPMIITEPALGNIGGALFSVFIDQNTPYIDTINGKIIKTRVKPTIYGFGGAYTANDSWVAGGMTMGVIKKWRANYRIATGYADINLNFYKEIPMAGEQSFEFNLRTLPLTGQLIKQFGRSDWFAGLNYLFLNTRLTNSNPLFNTPEEINSTVSRLGIVLEYDSRDNIFTPDKGFLWNTVAGGASNVIGSDFKFTSVNSAGIGYFPIRDNLISGFRLEYQQIFGDYPFYMKPYVNIRGIPVMRYQGETITLAETEWRWDFLPRYSLVGFAGTAKAIDKGSSFNDTPWRVSGGLGGRYLLARKLKIRMGIDVARGPEDWAYYVVLGTNWNR